MESFNKKQKQMSLKKDLSCCLARPQTIDTSVAKLSLHLTGMTTVAQHTQQLH